MCVCTLHLEGLGPLFLLYPVFTHSKYALECTELAKPAMRQYKCNRTAIRYNVLQQERSSNVRSAVCQCYISRLHGRWWRKAHFGITTIRTLFWTAPTVILHDLHKQYANLQTRRY